MAISADSRDTMPVVRDLADFNPKSGSALEQLVFNNRVAVVTACLILTIALGIVAVFKLTLNASFERMLPQSHPYIQN